MYRMRRGTGAVVVVGAVWVAHVRFVIRAIEILAVPACGEKDLGAQTIRARIGGDVVCLGFVGTQAVEGYALRREIGAAAAFARVAGQHAETGREGSQVVVGRALEIVDGHAAAAVRWVANDGDGLEGAVFLVHVELGGPVVGKIFLYTMSA
jgi:hypothetical protein